MELIARPLRPSPAIAAALMLTLVAALLVPFENQGVTWLQHAGDPVPAGARIIERLSVAGAVVVSGSRAPDTAIDADARLRWESLGGAADPALDAQTDSGVASTRASQAWADSDAGKHAVVALIDTGVAAVPALRDAVAGEIDFSGSGSGSGGGDGYGHGTFLASLIAGRGPVAPGVAPRAGILSLKVAGPDGSTTLGSVLSALQWLDGPGQAAGIRVAALALAVDPDTEAAQLLDRAIERLATDGVLVITASGNAGPGALTSPATSPGSLSVGATDDQGTPNRDDDVPAAFSSSGVDRDGVAQPDLHASGVRNVGSLPPDSVIARSYPDAVTDDGLFRGSGTSMSTALAAGVAALASSARPDLDGDALSDALLVSGGELDAVDTVAAALAADASKGKGKGKDRDKDKDRGDDRGDRGDDDGKDDDGVRGHGKGRGHGRNHDFASPQAVRWAAVRWAAVRWTAVRWAGDHWGDEDWELAQWGAVRWAGDHWVAGEWNGEDFGAVRWAAVRWAAVRWTAVRWTAVRWAGDSPSGDSWAGDGWAAVRWAGESRAGDSRPMTGDS
ncbi:MAG: S8 family serine peptidase [Euzebyaceae bacterium]|nr:S8 family serine peptidase [Euzebyaceae bacterium]